MKRASSVGLLLASLFLGFTTVVKAGEHIVYTLYADSTSLSNVTLGGKNYTGLIKLQFESDTSQVRLAYEGTPKVPVYRNDRGRASITITQGGREVVASIAPGQIYVRWDPTNGVIGFGSYSSGNFYPMALSCEITPCDGNWDIPGPMIAGAMFDVFKNSSDSQNYSLPQLTTDLQGPVLMTGQVAYCERAGAKLSCITHNGPLKTDRGDLSLNYLAFPSGGGGVFVAVTGEDGEDD